MIVTDLMKTQPLRPVLRLQAYRLFSRIAHRRPSSSDSIQNYVGQDLSNLEAGRAKGGIMVYAATIGEFQAVRPLIDALGDRLPLTPLVLLAGQSQYQRNMQEAYPKAIVAGPPNLAPNILDRFFALVEPRFVIFAEGPSLHARFPIRLDLSLPAACLYHRTPLFVANACVYELHLPSRIDRIEHKLFSSLHLHAVTQWFTPAPVFAAMLQAAGADEQRVTITGDTKFDTALSGPHRKASAELKTILSHIEAAGAPVIVAGSVNAIDEQKAVIAGWAHVRCTYPGALLVIAPRYINNAKVMDELYGYLGSKNIPYARRSEGPECVRRAAVLVVDVFGELPFYYEHAAICYIGRNHGVLEPLRYAKPTVVAPRRDWRKDYAAYPLYHLLVEHAGILEVENKSMLGDVFMRLLEDGEYRNRYVENSKSIVREQCGATQRILQNLSDGGFI